MELVVLDRPTGPGVIRAMAMRTKYSPGRPAMGSAASSVESVRLDPELKRDLLLRAAAEHTSVSQIIRDAVRQYLRAG